MYSVRYVEPPSVARTKLADFFNILLGDQPQQAKHYDEQEGEEKKAGKDALNSGPVPG